MKEIERDISYLRWVASVSKDKDKLHKLINLTISLYVLTDRIDNTNDRFIDNITADYDKTTKDFLIKSYKDNIIKGYISRIREII